MNDHQSPSPDQTPPPLNLQKFAPAMGGEPDPVITGEEGQTMFIKKSAAQSVAQRGDPALDDDNKFGLAVKDMLGLITYCYVRGVFSSKEISERLDREPQLRKRFGSKLPDEQAIKAFRRRYAAEIEDLLETVYRAFPSDDSQSSAEPRANETELVHRKAVERLHDASWEDAMRRHLH